MRTFKLRIAAILLGITLCTTFTLRAQSVFYPTASAFTEANGRAFTAPLNNASRLQQIFSASAFGATPVTITKVAIRPDAAQVSSFSNAFTRLRIDLSTASVAVGGLSATFAANIGGNNATVFDGAITLSTTNQLGPGTSKLFDVVIPLTTPFSYNPTAGNLLLDIRNYDVDFTGYIDTQVGSGNQLVFSDSGPTATAGTVQAAGLVIRFTILEPPPIISISRSVTGNQYSLIYTGRVGAYYTLQSSTDLSLWSSSGSVLTTTGTNVIALIANANETRRFWRLKQE